MAGDLGRLTATIEARAERFDLTLQRATQRLDRIAAQTEQANTRIGRSHAAMEAFASRAARGVAYLTTAAAGAGAALAFFAARQFQALDKLGDLASQTGLTADELRKLQVGLELNGGSAEQAGEGILTFARNLAQAEAGTGRFASFLAKLDPAFLQAVKGAGSTSDALRLVADRIAVARSEQEKLAIATAAFGPAGRQFVLLLGAGSRGLDALSTELETVGVGGRHLDDLVPRVKRFNEALVKLRATASDQFVAGLFGVGDGIEAIDQAVSDQQFAENIGIVSNLLGEMAAKAIEAAVGLAEAAGGMQTFERLDLEENLAEARTALQDFDQYLARRGLDRGAGLRGGEKIELGPGAFGPLFPRTRREAEAISLLRERARLAQVVADLERQLAAASPHPLPRVSGAGATSVFEGGGTKSERAALREREQARTRDYNAVLQGLRLEEQASERRAQLLEQQAAANERISDEITRDWIAATGTRVELLEYERDQAIEKAREAWTGSAEEMQVLEDRIRETYQVAIDEADPLRAKWDEITDFGEQVFGDMVEGWVQGAEVSFDGILRSFVAMLLKMEAEALAADIGSAITGSGGGGESGIWGLLLGLGNLVVGGGTGGVESFADGGIVRRPTLALIGESGPEAVVPLAAFGDPAFAGQADASRAMGGGVSFRFEQRVEAGVSASQPKLSRGPDGDWVLQQIVTRALANDARANGPIAQTMQPNGPQAGLR
jgi:hypothetical protein